MASTAQHTFAVCAYGKSPYLRECLDSLRAQRGPESEVFIATSTPSEWLDDIASEYGLPVYVNTGKSGIGEDWNFAYLQASSQFVTIAHQDDVYLPDYARAAVDALSSDVASLIYFCDYGELRCGLSVDDSDFLTVKRRLLRRLANPANAAKRNAKRSALRFGSAICCPAVTFNAKNCPNPPFVVGMKSNLDWATWEVLSRLDGSFLYDKDHILMRHRIHPESTTSELIASRKRDEEDLEMLQKFWPNPVAALIEHVYSRGTKSNEL
ncbi:glycosyltransferase [Paratractidigestivibacter sp.]|uniref:glycosyltransferase n=1 Tax=Paratractidigestivibacter sp. TaxID=2847316 RepID=UPI002ACB05DD|nr:glycosyltransferase [Paratractidigestivibacter sp.]